MKLSSSFTSIVFYALVTLLSACESKQVEVKEVVKAPDNSTKVKDVKIDDDMKYILFFGNSLTAGYGLEEEESFPSLIQVRINAKKLKYKVINAGLSGETTAEGKARVNWVLKQDVDIFVLELGANDMLRGLDVKATKKNLQSIIDQVRKKNKNIKIILAGMQAPPNMGKDYVDFFNNLYPDLAKENGAKLIPFLLEGVAQIPELNLADGKHPNAEGQKIVMENVWTVLKGVL